MLVATQITRALAELIDDCTAARGYRSDVGANVHVGLILGSAIQAPATFVIPGRQSAEPFYNDVFLITREYELRGFADLEQHPDLDEAALVDLVIWDLRRCIELQELALAQVVERVAYAGDRPGYREGGGTVVGAIVNYNVSYSVGLTDPETAV